MRSSSVRSLMALVAIIVGSVAASAHGQSGPRFYADDPIWRDNDRVVDVKRAREIKLDDYFDFIENTLMRPGDRSRIRALNVNTLDEVPDSSWFTNRIGRRDMGVAELVTGPDRPVTFSGAWTIVRGKNRGFQPGFRAVDPADPTGTVYQLEVDPPGHPEMATGAEVIGTAFYHAFGYHTVDVYLTTIDPNRLRIAPDATIRDANGRRPFTPGDLQEILKNAARRSDGRIRVSAERFLDGDDMGRFEYHGTRDDDPNDIYPHEHRRELRGSRVFAAWLNHDDSRAVNTMVMRHRDDGKRYLKYYIVDFGSLLGSATRFADGPQSGREHALAVKPSLLTFLSFGLYVRPWLRAAPPEGPPAVGRFSADRFDPRAWVAEYPKVAYDNMRDDDAFWAARIVARFSDEDIRAIVSKAQYSDPAATNALTTTLIRRRDRIKDTWLTGVTPITDVRLAPDGTLTFDNVAVRHGVGSAASGYGLTWSRFDNASGIHAPLGAEVISAVPPATAPIESFGDADYVSVSIRVIASGPGWRPVTAYFRRTPRGWQTVGLDRELPASPAAGAGTSG